MPEINLSPPPRKDSARFDDWVAALYRKVSSLETTVTEEVTTVSQSHSDLSNLNSSQYTHLSAINASDLTDGGDSSLHYHGSDRSRSNHTGSQSASTISDFNSAVQAAMTQSNGVLEAQVFGG